MEDVAGARETSVYSWELDIVEISLCNRFSNEYCTILTCTYSSKGQTQPMEDQASGQTCF
jgi:hypothetical protein